MKLTRKILASILALVMVLLLLPAAFADEAANELVIGDTAIAGEDAEYTYTAAENGVLTLTPTGPAFSTPATVFVLSYTVNGGESVNLPDRTSTEVSLNAGDVVVVTITASKANGTLNAAWAAAEAEAPANELVIGDTAINGEDAEYTYTAAENGVLTLTPTGPAFSTPATVFVLSYTVNGGESVNLPDRTATEVTLNAGDVVVVTITASRATGTLNAAWAANTSGDQPEGPSETVDLIGIAVAMMAASGTALVCLKKKED